MFPYALPRGGRPTRMSSRMDWAGQLSYGTMGGGQQSGLCSKDKPGWARDVAREWLGSPQMSLTDSGDSRVISDGFGGAIVVWTDLRPVNASNIYAQKLNENGDRLWGNTGLAVCTKSREPV